VNHDKITENTSDNSAIGWARLGINTASVSSTESCSNQWFSNDHFSGSI